MKSKDRSAAARLDKDVALSVGRDVRPAMLASHTRRFLFFLAVALLTACGKSNKSGSLAKPPTLPSNDYILGEVVVFGRDGVSERYIRGGWGDTEDDRTWTNGHSADLHFAPREGNEPLRLRMKLAGFTHPPALPYQPVEVYVNDERVADWQVSEPADFFAIIPRDLAEHQRLWVQLRMPQAASPKTLSIGEDPRTLGVSCFDLAISKTTAEVVRQAREERAQDPLKGFNDAYSLGTTVYLGAGAGGQRFKASGWHTAEKKFTWTGSDPGVLELSLPPTDQPLKLRMRLGGMIEPRILPMQPTQVFANGKKIADWQVAEPAEFAAIIPPELSGENGKLRIELRARAAASSKELEIGDDMRPLGVRCESFIIEEAPSGEI